MQNNRLSEVNAYIDMKHEAEDAARETLIRCANEAQNDYDVYMKLAQCEGIDLGFAARVYADIIEEEEHDMTNPVARIDPYIRGEFADDPEDYFGDDLTESTMNEGRLSAYQDNSALATLYGIFMPGGDTGTYKTFMDWMADVFDDVGMKFSPVPVGSCWFMSPASKPKLGTKTKNPGTLKFDVKVCFANDTESFIMDKCEAIENGFKLVVKDYNRDFERKGWNLVAEEIEIGPNNEDETNKDPFAVIGGPTQKFPYKISFTITDKNANI